MLRSRLYCQRTKTQPATGHGRSSQKLYYQATRNQRRHIKLAARDGRSSKIAREGESSRPPRTAGPVLKLLYRRTNIQPTTEDGGFSTTDSGTTNPARRRRRRFVIELFYSRPFEHKVVRPGTTRERKSSWPTETDGSRSKLTCTTRN